LQIYDQTTYDFCCQVQEVPDDWWDGWGHKEVTEKVETVLVHKMCKCGGEMLPTGQSFCTYPASYVHRCNKCGTNEEYSISYPELRYLKK